jgi:hypothetical protein
MPRSRAQLVNRLHTLDKSLEQLSDAIVKLDHKHRHAASMAVSAASSCLLSARWALENDEPEDA